tara:strand:- start:3879 stop:4043 length:165 start_codon:yes stop_codon:yes gene_type:complete
MEVVLIKEAAFYAAGAGLERGTGKSRQIFTAYLILRGNHGWSLRRLPQCPLTDI